LKETLNDPLGSRKATAAREEDVFPCLSHCVHPQYKDPEV